MNFQFKKKVDGTPTSDHTSYAISMLKAAAKRKDKRARLTGQHLTYRVSDKGPSAENYPKYESSEMSSMAATEKVARVSLGISRDYWWQPRR